MPRSEVGKAVLGVTAWLLVAALALVAVDRWDPLWGFFPVAAAVVAAWAVGEWVTWRGGHDATS